MGPWDFPPEPFPNFQMEPMFPRLPSIEPQPTVAVTKLSSMATLRAVASSPPLPEYHPGADPSFEEDLNTRLPRRIYPKSDLRQPAAPHMRPGPIVVLAILR